MQVDGANAWTRYWRLALPLARPALATATIFTFLAAWDEFAWALTIINNPDKQHPAARDPAVPGPERRRSGAWSSPPR